MKRITLTAVFSLLSSFAFADHFATLAGARDSITLKEGEAALITFVTDAPTVQYEKKGRRPVQMQLGLTRQTESRYNFNVGSSAYPARVDSNPSANRPLALAGPATVKLMTDGVVSLRVVKNK